MCELTPTCCFVASKGVKSKESFEPPSTDFLVSKSVALLNMAQFEVSFTFVT